MKFQLAVTFHSSTGVVVVSAQRMGACHAAELGDHGERQTC